MTAAAIVGTGITLATAAAAFAAMLPISGGLAVTAGVLSIVNTSTLKQAAAYFVVDHILTRMIESREKEVSKAAPEDDPVLSTLRALQRELHANKHKFVKKGESAEKRLSHVL